MSSRWNAANRKRNNLGLLALGPRWMFWATVVDVAIEEPQRHRGGRGHNRRRFSERWLIEAQRSDTAPGPPGCTRPTAYRCPLRFHDLLGHSVARLFMAAVISPDHPR